MSGFACGLSSSVATIFPCSARRPSGCRARREPGGDGAGVGVELLSAERFAVEEELDLFGVGVDFHVFSVRVRSLGSSRRGEARRSARRGRAGPGCGAEVLAAADWSERWLRWRSRDRRGPGARPATRRTMATMACVDHQLWRSKARARGGAWSRAAGRSRSRCGPAAGFAEVVDAGPEELAGVLGVVAHGDPLVAVVGVFSADDFAGGLLRVRGENLLLAVVLADDVEQIGEAVVVVVAGVRTEERLRHGPGGIVCVEGLRPGCEDGDGDIRLGRVVDLVAGGPEDDAGMVAVAHDGVGRVAHGPVLEVEVIVVGILCDGPAVEHLVHDQEAHAVGEVEELRRGRVVRGADGVDAELAQLGEAAFPDGERNGGADGAGVGVESYAVDLVMDAVEEEALVGVEVEFADAERDVFLVDGLAVAQQRGVAV